VGSAHSETHIFRTVLDQNFKIFLRPSLGHHFYSFWEDLVPKNLILGAPWRPAGSQHGTQNHPSGTKRLPFSSLRARRFEDLLPRSLSEQFLGTILVDFGSSLAPTLRIFKRFAADFNQILGINLGNRFAPCYVNAFPKNIILRLPIHRSPLGRHLIKMGGYFAIGAGVVQNSARHEKQKTVALSSGSV